jgi:glycosyltransferase involved in cell wall biosynthesis
VLNRVTTDLLWDIDMAKINFSLIMSVYAKENPLFLSQCLDSILAQTVMPDEFIIIKDGPLTNELEQVLSAAQFPFEVNIISLPENITQGPARAEGVKAAKHEWVAIMDSDDICRPDRFKKQLAMLSADPDLDLIGGQIDEFNFAPGDLSVRRGVPTGHSDILTFAKKRNPFSHMTVMLRRELAVKAGNYVFFPWFEDYDLWARMLKNGAKCANHPDILVDARVGGGMYARRRGITYIRSELRMQKSLLNLGMINYCEFLRNLTVRVPVRFLPAKALKFIYNLTRKT